MVCCCLGMFCGFELFVYLKYLLSTFHGFEVLRPKEGNSITAGFYRIEYQININTSAKVFVLNDKCL